MASFCHFKFCMKARQNNATHSLNSQKDLTPGTLPITVLHNSETCIHCVKNIILPYVSATHKDLVLGEEHMAVVIFDTFKGHTGSEMESSLLENDIISVYAPSNCTDLLQSLDLCLNKPLKDHLRSKFQSWYSE